MIRKHSENNTPQSPKTFGRTLVGKKLITIIFFYFSGFVYSQNTSIKMINLSDKKIEFIFFDSTQTSISYQLIKSNNNLSFYQTKKEDVYINPFIGTNQDSIINEMLLVFIKRNYNYEKAKMRLSFGSPVEAIKIVLEVDTNGLISNYGFYVGSNEKEFEKEIYQILTLLNSAKIIFPLFSRNSTKYSYLKTYFFSNYSLFEN